MGAASMPVTGAPTGITGGGTTVSSVNSTAGSSSDLAWAAALRANSEPSVAIRALGMQSSFPLSEHRRGMEVLDQVREAGVGVEAAGRRHHVGGRAAEPRRLRSRLGV